MRGETRYAASGGVNIAYQVVGDGPRALLFVPGWVSHLDLQWLDPTYARFLRHLASFSRLVMFDKRGVGLSDPVAGAPTLDERMEDIRIVLDAAGVEKTSIFALSEGAPVSALFAATYPERVEHLVLYGGFAAGWAVPDAPARTDHLRGLAPIYEQLEHGEWGTGASLDVFAPDLASKPAIRKAFGMFERSSVSPGMAKDMLSWISRLDVRAVLPLVQAPTLVVHRRGDHVPVEAGRALAEGIPGARFLVLEGNAHAPVSGNVEDVVGAVEEHVTGTRRDWAPERILATVAFTDLVGSTEHAAAIGNRAWHDLVERHDAVSTATLERFGGVMVKFTGDGVLARFDSPARALRWVAAARDGLASLDLQVRAGVHTGECEQRGDDLVGLSVNIAARLLALAEAGETLVTGTVRDLVIGSAHRFEQRGSHELRGVPGVWPVLAHVGEQDIGDRGPGRGPELRAADRAAQFVARRVPALGRATSRVARGRTR